VLCYNSETPEYIEDNLMLDLEWMELPSESVWNSRKNWFKSAESSYINEHASYFVDDQACALLGEVQIAFCAGAWITVIVMAKAVIESSVDNSGDSKLQDNPKYQKLRKKRNNIVHNQPNNPGITLDQQWFSRKELEIEAKEAIKQMFDIFYNDNIGT
jgi:hypothetical protein